MIQSPGLWGSGMSVIMAKASTGCIFDKNTTMFISIFAQA